MIDPKKVVDWAEAEHAAGRITGEVLAPYRDVAETLATWMDEDPDAIWGKMGHVRRSAGHSLLPRQFAAVRSWASGEMHMMLHLHGNEPVEIDTLNANTRSKKPNAPTHYGFFDR